MLVVSFHGNTFEQLFQFAFYLKLQEDYPSQLVCADSSYYKNNFKEFILTKYTKLHFIDLNKSKNSFITINLINDYENLQISDNNHYIFFFENISYTLLPKDLTPFQLVLKRMLSCNKYKAIRKQILSYNSISISIKHKDSFPNQLMDDFTNLPFYQYSIDYISQNIDNPFLLFFTDDIELCQKSLKTYNIKTIFFNNDIIQELCLSSICKINITGNDNYWNIIFNFNKSNTYIYPNIYSTQKHNLNFLKNINCLYFPNIESNEIQYKNPFFSIIIPVHNSENTIIRTISSIINQTFNKFEVIIIDDCSTDHSISIINQFISKDKRINLFQNKTNLGVLTSRNIGIEKAIGQYILFLDSDDWYNLTALQLLYEKLIMNPVDMLEFGYIREPSGCKSTFIYNKENRFFDIINNKYPVTLWNKVYNRLYLQKVLSSFDTFYTCFAEDAFFSIIISFFNPTIDYLPYHIHHYSISTGISTKKQYSLESFIKISNDIYSVLQHLELFFKYNNISVSLENFKNLQLCTLLNLSKMSSDYSTTLKKIQYIDKLFNTTFFIDETNNIYNQFKYYEKINNSGIKQKIRIILSECLIKLKNKLHIL